MNAVEMADELWKTFEGNYDHCVGALDSLPWLLKAPVSYRDDVLRSLQIREAHESWKTFEGNYDRCVRDLNTLSGLLEELKWLD